jgi:hypothetical protein
MAIHLQKLKIGSILNIEQMHVNTATPNHLQLQATTASRVLQTRMSKGRHNYNLNNNH